MILAVILSATSLAQSPAAISLDEVNRAIAAGRIQQARSMIATAIANGSSGDGLELALADVDAASGKCSQSLPRYRGLLDRRGADPALFEKAGLAALKCDRFQEAEGWIASATSSGRSTWKAWNAQGVLADFRQDWPGALSAYSKAAEIAPNSAEVLNNLGWSYFLQRRWAEALELINNAALLDPQSKRIARNLELARAAVDDSLPRRKAGESADDWAARINDAGVIAGVQGKVPKARSAFAQAVEVRPEWFDRAANNLKALDTRK
ncbi:MAG: tetratricopeptide repeat protein [Sphingomicrobium sp.]